MHLQSARLINYRCHQDLEVRFTSQFSAIAGLNASGKSCLLDGVSEVLRCYYPMHGPAFQQNAIRVLSQRVGNSWLLQPQYPVSISLQIVEGQSTFELQLSRTLESSGNLPHPPTGPLSFNPSSSIWPLLIYYRAGRRWATQPVNVDLALKPISRMDAVTGCFAADQDIGNLLSWVTSKTFERMQRCSETGILFDSVDDDELALVNRALMAALPESRGLRFDMTRKELLWATLDTVSPFANLSDGQRGVIAMVYDIARRACMLNPSLEQSAVTQTPGVVLIDELELHLHPRWQRELTRALRRAFPGLQFIVTSHSPQILSELQPEEIVLLRPEGTGHPQVSYGLDSSRVLEEIMEASARPAEIQTRLNSLFRDLETGSLEAARIDLTSLQKDAPGIPDLVRAEALLKRKELLGR